MNQSGIERFLFTLPIYISTLEWFSEKKKKKSTLETYFFPTQLLVQLHISLQWQTSIVVGSSFPNRQHCLPPSPCTCHILLQWSMQNSQQLWFVETSWFASTTRNDDPDVDTHVCSVGEGGGGSSPSPSQNCKSSGTFTCRGDSYP